MDDEQTGSLEESGVSVRRADAKDWSLLKAIRLEALGDTPDAYGSTLDAALDFSDDRWRAMVEQHCYFLVVRDGVVVGMASGGYNDDHPGTHWMYGMYVTPRARGTAAAPLLVDAVFAWADREGASELYLHVTASVERARAFYKKLGFRPTGERFAMNRDPSLVLMSMRRDVVVP